MEKEYKVESVEVISPYYDFITDCFNPDIEEIIIPSVIKHIPSEFFNSRLKLKTVKLPDELEIINSHAFYNCKSLESIVIPISVTGIGGYAFAQCSSLTIYCEAESKPDGWDKAWNDSNCPVVWGYKGVSGE